jgi:predicted DNA-binding antitoxin AbrB/MazE fold protein
MQTITATYENGVLKPTQPLDLPAHAEVRLTIEVLPAPRLPVGDVLEYLRGLPSLGDDAEAFAQDIRDVLAAFPAEKDPWD